MLLPRRQVAALLRLASKIKSEGRRDTENPGDVGEVRQRGLFDWASRLLFDRKLNPRMPADLWRGALDAYVEAGHPGGVPSEDWARKKIKRLWFAPGLGDKN